MVAPTYSTNDILLGKYRIQGLIGEGAFGQVYRVEHLSLRAPRALKILRRDAPGLGSSEFERYRDRFELEARLGALIDDPGVVRVYDFEQEGEMLALVMEYCPGGSLAGLIRQQKQQGQMLPLERVVELGLQAAQGLAVLHAQDIVHRDIKPSNLLIGANGKVKVGDLGLVQTSQSLDLRTLQGSQGYDHPGDAYYMPPEQRPGQKMALRPSADVYALGGVLFELLTGRVYFLQKPGTRLSQLRGDVPQWLERLVMQMLSPSAEERPWDGAEVIKLCQAGIEQEAQRKRASEQAAELAEKQGLAAESNAAAARQAEAQSLKAAQAQQEERRRARAASLHRLLPWLAGAVLLAALSLGGYFAIKSLQEDRQARVYATQSAEAFQTASETQDTADLQPTEQVIVETDTPTPDPKVLPDCTAIGQTWTSPKDGMVLVCVPAGEFRMGSENGDDDEKPVHPVRLDAYWIDQTEVTNAMFADFIQETGYQTQAEADGKGWAFTGSGWSEVAGANWQHPNGPETSLEGLETHPVVQVSWNDAAAYCEWAGRELPTEAQWEKAARGRTGGPTPGGTNLAARRATSTMRQQSTLLL